MKSINNYEYYINYPEDNASLDKNLDIDEKKPPLIVIFGWSGSVYKHLNVYANMYNQKGFMTFSCICPVDVIFLRQSKMPKIVADMMEKLEKLHASERPIIIHLFSNGGSVQYDFFRKAAKQNLDIKGVIFDSAPGSTTFINTYRAFQGIYSSKFGIFSIPVNFVLSFLLYTIHSITKFCHKFNKNIYVMEQLDNLKDEQNTCPQHFIYSKTDVLIPYADVERFMDHRKSLGVDISSIRYENTPHVRHYQSNKVTYSRSVFNFLSKCLRK